MWGIECLSRIQFFSLLVFLSICFMLRLLTTPLRFANIQLNVQVLNWDMPEAVLISLVHGEESHVTETVGHEDASFHADEPKPALARSLEYPKVSLASFCPDLPETVMEPDPQVNALKENHSVAPSVSTSDSGIVSKIVINDSSSTDSKLEDMKTIIETNALIEKIVEIDSNVERDDDDVDSWETEESSRAVLANASSSTSEGPISLRSISGKSDDGGGSCYSF
jgi:ethylene-insensitive protein 2